MRRLSTLVSALLGALFLSNGVPAAEPVQVVASTLDMADFARQIGGDRVEVHAITKGRYDLHFFEPRPSEVMKLRRADLVIVVGMELDAFMPGLLDACRNPDIKYGSAGFVDPSRGVKARDVPTQRISGDMGDVHPYGNPHFWYTAENVRIACSNITAGLVRVSPEDEAYFREREAAYVEEVTQTFERLRRKLAPYQGAKVLQFHPSWDYFCEEFGLEIVGSVEPKPGIAPSASHLSSLVRLIREEGVKTVLVEPFYPDRPLRFLRRNTGIRTLRLPLLLGGRPEATTYLENLELIVGEIEAALRE
jgi:ABC-type Zn uptake system ZnuABC Zn-binding protein ZnuA